MFGSKHLAFRCPQGFNANLKESKVMRIFVACAVLNFLIAASAVAQTEKPEKSICPVCALREGESKPEVVKAWSEYEGKMYYFCSEGCKKEFDADPLGYAPPILPRPAPSFTAESMKGEEVTLKIHENKIVLLDFWATWCKPCEKAMSELQKLHDELADKNFVVVGISIDEGGDARKKVEKFIEKRKIFYPIWLDTSASPAWAAFRVKAIPAMFLIDRTGEIVQQWAGAIGHEKIKAEVTSLINKAK